MGLFKLITAKKKNSNPNQEFNVVPTYDFNDENFSQYNQVSIEELEFDIIKAIKNGSVYKTRNIGYTFTLCKIGKRGEQEYLTSIPNDSEDDNIESLPQYD